MPKPPLSRQHSPEPPPELSSTWRPKAVGFADQTTDIYSLSKVALEILAARSLSELLPDAALDRPARLREFCVTTNVPLSPEGISLLSQAPEFDPARRPRSAGEFANRIADSIHRTSGQVA